MIEMVGKKSNKALLRDEGLERTDNNLPQTTWPQVPMINQKNYYTEYLKRDDQALCLRLVQEERRNQMTANHVAKDRARAQAAANDEDGDAMEVDDEAGLDEATELSGDYDPTGSKVVIIHPGSQYLRIGLGSDVLPKSVPMVIARKSKCNESEEGGTEPMPKRVNGGDGADARPEESFGPEVS